MNKTNIGEDWKHLLEMFLWIHGIEIHSVEWENRSEYVIPLAYSADRSEIAIENNQIVVARRIGKMDDYYEMTPTGVSIAQEHMSKLLMRMCVIASKTDGVVDWTVSSNSCIASSSPAEKVAKMLGVHFFKTGQMEGQ